MRAPTGIQWIVFSLALTGQALAEGSSVARTQEVIGGPWRFVANDTLVGAEASDFDTSAWTEVTIPHTWQTLNDQRDYSHAWYRTTFVLPATDKTKRVYLRFEGAGITANVYLNGVHLGRHVGAYTAFTLDATETVCFGGKNVLAVRCDSKEDIRGNLSRPDHKPNYYWNVVGGLHRKVWLLKTESTHIDPMHFGSDGVFVTGRKIAADQVTFEIGTRLRNAGKSDQVLDIAHTIVDPAGKVVTVLKGRVRVAAAATANLTLEGELNRPMLWSTTSPSLYRIETRLLHRGRIVDGLDTVSGFRSFAMDKDGHFRINGERIRLIGASYLNRDEKSFHAQAREEFLPDFQRLQALNFNCMAGFQLFPQFIFEEADRSGILVWAENGFVGTDKLSSHGRGSYEPDTSAQITREMVYQNWNHPSIFAWSAGNEVNPNDCAFPLIEVLCDLSDPNRLVVYNSVPQINLQRHPRLDLLTLSRFSGWYQGGPFDCKDRYINQHGAGAHVAMQESYRTPTHKVDTWEPEAYQQVIAEAKCHQVYEEGMHDLYTWFQLKDQESPKLRALLNSKGLLTMAGYPKDVFFLFKAYGRPGDPLIHLCGKHWFLRDANELKVYSNRPRLSLRVNGVSRGELVNGKYEIEGRRIRNVFLWADVFDVGRNEIEVSDGEQLDRTVIYYQHGEKAVAGLVRAVNAGNGTAHLLDMAATAQWPFYCQFDGNAINTFAELPERLKGARWISTQRQSDRRWRTSLSLEADADLDVYIMTGLLADLPPAWLTELGFKDTNVRGVWRDNDLRTRDYILMVRPVRAGERVDLRPAGALHDWVCLLKRAETTLTR